MSQWIADLIKAVLPALSGRITQVIAYFLGKSAGRASQRAAQDAEDLKRVKRAADAGRDLKLDADSLRDSKNNRDNW